MYRDPSFGADDAGADADVEDMLLWLRPAGRGAPPMLLLLLLPGFGGAAR